MPRWPSRQADPVWGCVSDICVTHCCVTNTRGSYDSYPSVYHTWECVCGNGGGWQCLSDEFRTNARKARQLDNYSITTGLKPLLPFPPCFMLIFISSGQVSCNSAFVSCREIFTLYKALHQKIQNSLNTRMVMIHEFLDFWCQG